MFFFLCLVKYQVFVGLVKVIDEWFGCSVVCYTCRSHSDLCFYAIKDGQVVNVDTSEDLFDKVNTTTAQCSAAASSCPSNAVSVSRLTCFIPMGFLCGWVVWSRTHCLLFCVVPTLAKGDSFKTL